MTGYECLSGAVRGRGLQEREGDSCMGTFSSTLLILRHDTRLLLQPLVLEINGKESKASVDQVDRDVLLCFVGGSELAESAGATKGLFSPNEHSTRRCERINHYEQGVQM